MPKNYNMFIAAAYIFLIQEENILLMRRFNTGYEDGNYGLPSGHIEHGEKVETALIREAKEETGIDIHEADLKMVHIIHCISIGTHPSGCDHRIDFFMMADTWTGNPIIMEPNKCDDMQWFPIDNLPSNTIPYIRSAIQHYKNGVMFSEFGW